MTNNVGNLEALRAYLDENEIASLQKVFEGNITINEAAEIVNRISTVLFKKICNKINYLDNCEPAFCAFRINGSCRYPMIIGKVYDELIKKLLTKGE